MLKWLGYGAGDTVYNQTIANRPQDRPDFVVNHLLGSTAFVVEDKSTDEEFNEDSVKQLRRYVAGTSGYCLWTNGRTILGLRFDPNGNYRTLVEVRVDGTFGVQRSLFPQEAHFEVLRLLFNKDRFSGAADLIQSICINETEWRNHARSLTDMASILDFIIACRYVLDQLATSVKARLITTSMILAEAADDYRNSRDRYLQAVEDLIVKLRGSIPAAGLTAIESVLRGLAPVLADVDVSQIESLRPSSLGTAAASVWDNGVQHLAGVVSALRERELARSEARRIRAAYMVWRERYRIIEPSPDGQPNEIELRRQQAFAEQVSYVFFVRLLLARVLEDKGIMHRLVSDGGFSAWYEFLRQYATDSPDDIQGESFLPLVYRRVARYYKHFFQQPVFDWFVPDDYLVALVLARLNEYDFGQVTSDLLGFVYEAFIDRTTRNQKGHFLTPPDLVEFILDRADYSGASRIIGETLLDPACGSGSFLVHSARRMRSALATAMQAQGKSELELARQFVVRVQTDLVGLEINPFSCYLAELNLFIQVLDDLVVLWEAGERADVDRFAVYNTNSLEMPREVLYLQTGSLEDRALASDEAAAVKVRQGGFGFVVFNPPYVNRGIILGAEKYKDFPFYRQILQGDENLYLVFLRLAAYYVNQGGTISLICPLNIFGDQSTMRARELFGAAEWRIQSLTRFYSRTVLFKGVLQGVCVVRYDKALGAATDDVEVRGGESVGAAALPSAAITVQRQRITANHGTKTTWNKVWLVNASTEAYDLWEFIKRNSSLDLEDLIHNKLEVTKGDVRSTWSKPMLVDSVGSRIISVTKGDHIDDWGSVRPSAYLDPDLVVHSTVPNYSSVLWVQRRLQRVAALTQPETVILLKEVSGLEMKRPIRGTILQRSATQPLVADETALVAYTLTPNYSELAHAIFGLVTSIAYNYLFSLFSTNPHANYGDILRLPVPNWTPDVERQLADGTKATLLAHQLLREHEHEFGIGSDGQSPLPSKVLQASYLPFMKISDLVLRGEMTLSGHDMPNRKLAGLLDTGVLSVASTVEANASQAIKAVLREYGNENYARSGKDVIVPLPRVGAEFLSCLQEEEDERNRRREAVRTAHKTLDDLVFDAYGITNPGYIALIESGVPWAN